MATSSVSSCQNAEIHNNDGEDSSEIENDLVEIVPAHRSCSSALLCPANTYEDLVDDDSEYPDPSSSSSPLHKIAIEQQLERCISDGTIAESINSEDIHISNNIPAEYESDPNDLSSALDKFSINSGHTLERSLSLDAQDVNDVQSLLWRNQRKHVFILSEAGKPVYSRYGKEDSLVTIMGVMQAIVSFIHVAKDTIRTIVCGRHKFTFLIRDHLILVCVSHDQSSTNQLLLQLSYVHNQIISVLTLTQLSQIFKKRRNYDLRRLIAGSEKFIDSLLDSMEQDACYMLGAVRCLPLDISIRDIITQTILQYAKIKDLVFAIVLAHGQLVSVVRMRKYYLHTVDLHLIINLVNASESFKAAESWTPICLPKFDSSGFLHAHISYLDDACHTCLLLLTVNKEAFFTLSSCKERIQNRLERHHCLTAISQSLTSCEYSVNECAVSELRHFLYMSRSTAQFTRPRLEAPYTTVKERGRLFGLYQYLHHTVHTSALKILYHVAPRETLLGWVTSQFELYVVFGPLVTKPSAIHAINKLLRWMKKEEDRLFILNSASF